MKYAGLLARIGARDSEEALYLMNQVPENRITERMKVAFSDYLGGKRLEDIGQDMNVRKSMASLLVMDAADRIRTYHEDLANGRILIARLSVRSRNALISEKMTTDEMVINHVLQNGPQHLLRISNLGMVSFNEICKVFSFDQAPEPDPSAFGSGEEDRDPSP